MAKITTRASLCAAKVEASEGTVTAPSAGTDAIALQPDFSIEPNFEQIENDELRASIGKAKTIQGLETPTGSISHYLRHSGVEGQEPNFGPLLYSLYGVKVVAATEYDTVSSSTTSLIKVNTGEGAQFQRGQGLLIKDPTNGYRIRALHSISGDDLTMGFQVPNAPASGVNLGKCVLYKPANTDHPTLSLWHYLGNGGAVQLLTGTRITSMSVDVTAGELINASFNFEGLKYHLNPITIANADRYIDWTDDDGTWAAAITAKTYRDPHELAQALQDAMNDQTTETITVVYRDSDGKFKITCTGTVLSLLWNSGTNTANTVGDKIGFLTAADDTGTGATTGYTSDNAQTYAFPYTAAFDDSDPVAAKNHEIMVGDADDYACFEASAVSISVDQTRATQPSVCAETGISGSIISERTVDIEITAFLSKYDADQFRRFRAGTDTRFQYSYGSKSSGNWIPGLCGYYYAPTANVTAFNIADEDGLAVLTMTLRCAVDDSGNPEIYQGFV